MVDDWPLIAASFMTQYQLRESDIATMEWVEFTTLLSGIMPDTPLGSTVQIRAEEDKDVLKNFTKEQHSIRNAWRSNHSLVEAMTEKEKKQSIAQLQSLFANVFSNKK